ncbi:MAG: cation:proton antiporter, partial [Brevinema sp.]
YLRHANMLRRESENKNSPETTVFSGEEEVALTMVSTMLRQYGATEEQIIKERRSARKKLVELGKS